VGGQDDDQGVPQELQVLGVHVQLLTVEFAQGSKTFLDAVQVLDGLREGGEHLLAMGLHLGVTNDGRGAGQVPKGGKEPLGPGLDSPGQGLAAALGHVDLAPEAGDELLLLGCPVHHGVDTPRVSLVRTAPALSSPGPCETWKIQRQAQPRQSQLWAHPGSSLIFIRGVNFKSVLNPPLSALEAAAWLGGLGRF
uniref:Uncharacterized protein n=1 Tax=Zosterops lateralis melanops TaxID=1220523 RepID=A0A8D2PUF8_ZOSLA